MTKRKFSAATKPLVTEEGHRRPARSKPSTHVDRTNRDVPAKPRQRVHASRQEQLRRRLAYQKAQTETHAHTQNHHLEQHSDAALAYPLTFFGFGSKPSPKLAEPAPVLVLQRFDVDEKAEFQPQVSAAEKWIESQWLPYVNLRTHVKPIQQWLAQCKRCRTYDLSKVLESPFLWTVENSWSAEKWSMIKQVYYNIPKPKECELANYSGLYEKNGVFTQTLMFDASTCFTDVFRNFYFARANPPNKSESQSGNDFDWGSFGRSDENPVGELSYLDNFAKRALQKWMNGFYNEIYSHTKGRPPPQVVESE